MHQARSKAAQRAADVGSSDDSEDEELAKLKAKAPVCIVRARACDCVRPIAPNLGCSIHAVLYCSIHARQRERCANFAASLRPAVPMPANYPGALPALSEFRCIPVFPARSPRWPSAPLVLI